jgi:hypothetical protein
VLAIRYVRQNLLRSFLGANARRNVLEVFDLRAHGRWLGNPRAGFHNAKLVAF